MALTWDVLGCAIVGMVWGTTNALLEQGVKRASSSSSSSSMLQPGIILPYILNQAGSLLFYVLLSSSELSVVGPLTNALTLIFTGIAAHSMSKPRSKGEGGTMKRSWIQIALGASLSFAGIIVCQQRS